MGDLSIESPPSAMHRDLIFYLVNHIFLPPSLPQKDDSNPRYTQCLLDFTLGRLEDFRQKSQADFQDRIDEAITVLNGFKAVQSFTDDAVAIDPDALLKALERTCTNGNSLPLYITAQNAGILVTKAQAGLDFELFELTPLNASIIGSQGRLQRRFPGHAISINNNVLNDKEFLSELAKTLAKMSLLSAPQTHTTSRKAGHDHGETRNTVNPKVVTELFSAFLLALGAPATVSSIRKNTREEVMYKSAELPWHRSPAWLMLRVVLQLTFSRSEKKPTAVGRIPQVGPHLYKLFMLNLMAELLQKACDIDLDSDHLSIMTSQVSRRSRKLGSEVDDNSRISTNKAIQRANHVLQQRFVHIQARQSCSLDFSRLPGLDFHHDTITSLPGLETFITSIPKRDSTKRVVNFVPKHQLKKHSPEHLPDSFTTDGAYQTFSLAAFEIWVDENLDRWLQGRIKDEQTCQTLCTVIQGYHAAASSVYQGNPEAKSVMILTILELWVACDKSGVQICGLLGAYYNPPIPMGLLQNLLLPTWSQTRRLYNVEAYLISRKAAATGPCIMTTFGSPWSFPNRYFDASLPHQELLARIEDLARRERERKKHELDEKLAQYKQLMRNYERANCEFETVYNQRRMESTRQHSSSCRKCHYHQQAKDLTIKVHEWPLPSDPGEAKTVVFELQPPVWFSAWRTTTVYLLLDVFDLKYNYGRTPEHQYSLASYNALSQFCRRTTHQRIGLLSKAKPHAIAHYSTKKVHLVNANNPVLVSNGLKFEYFDSSLDGVTSGLGSTSAIPEHLTYDLPTGSSALRKFLFRPAGAPNGPSPNTVIATQHECPDHLSLAEYKELCVMPLGYRLQWINILTQLQAPSVDFGKLETVLFVSQCAYQAGEPLEGMETRKSHSILRNPLFAKALLDALDIASDRLVENWQSSEAFRIFITIATRILTLTQDDDIAKGCLIYLSRVREITLGWVRLLEEKSRTTQDSSRGHFFKEKAIHTALISVQSFNVDERYLESVLASAHARSEFLVCSITIQEGTDPLENHGNLLFWQWQRLSHRSYCVLSRHFVTDSAALDKAVREKWSAYKPDAYWKIHSETHHEWLVSQNEARCVHINLLTGELLVDGFPLNRPPTEYEQHQTFKTLFGKTKLEVMPSDMPGMQFSTKFLFHGYETHLGMQHDSPELLVRARRHGQNLELVPTSLLKEYFPTHFVDEFVHWYNIDNDCIMFRPIDSPWTDSEKVWLLQRHEQGPNWTMRQDSSVLVSIKSSTAKALGSIFQTIESRLRLHCIMSSRTRQLEIVLSNKKIRFHLEPGDSCIMSREFRGMTVDRDQRISTLYGLRNRLILKNDEEPSQRLLVVPEGGELVFRKTGDHVEVQVPTDSSTTIFAYKVNELLGKLDDNGSLESKLYLCSLHALTSYCLPDPLTRRTGTEEALSILQSAAVRSFSDLSTKSIETLEFLASLTPGRCYYPKHLRVMQTVEWDHRLGFLAQHNDFHLAAESLFRQAYESGLFKPQMFKMPGIAHNVEPNLLRRDNIRSSIFRVSGFGLEHYTHEHDLLYKSRDGPPTSAQASRAFALSTIVHTGQTHPCISLETDLLNHLWKSLQHKVIRPLFPTDNITLQLAYSPQWLRPWNESALLFINKNWLHLWGDLAFRSASLNRYSLMLWFSTLAFESQADMTIIHILAFFLTMSCKMQLLNPPESRIEFDLKTGFQVNISEIDSLVEKEFHNLQLCPEANMLHRRDETTDSFQTRRRLAWECSKREVKAEMTNSFSSQWPCEVLTRSDGLQRTRWMQYLDIDKHLSNLLGALRESARCPFQQEYVDELERSYKALAENATTSINCTGVTSALRGELVDYMNKCRNRAEDAYKAMTESVCGSKIHTTGAMGAELGTSCIPLALDIFQAPRLSSRFFLQQLVWGQFEKLTEGWKDYIIYYGLTLTAWQRAQRVLKAYPDSTEMGKELGNSGHTNWNPRDHPEYILIEIESNILIRPAQEQIAAKMRYPSSGKNSVMQLNMGEGKSSTIVPMVATTLADKTRLARVIVSKPQSKQMFQMLVSKLGGLLNRQIFHLPFSRSVIIGETEARVIQRICSQCKDQGGVLLVQPEHILSFQLMMIEKTSVGDDTVGQILQETYEFLYNNCRDIVDESDENFSPKFEVAYTIGTQQPVDNSPERWMCIQEVLGIMNRCIRSTRKQFPHGIELSSGPIGCFPRTRLIEKKAQDHVLSTVAREICDKGLVGFPIQNKNNSMRNAVFSYISDVDVSSNIINLVEGKGVEGCWADSTRDTLLLIRGLFTRGVLAFAFGQKRWRVDFGTDGKRKPSTRLAVPYRAKDQPSARSEFIHPDVVIVLTCLSYYYQGLSNDQLDHAFSHLERSDQADSEYQAWVNDAAGLPQAFHQLSGLNLEDSIQCSDRIYPCLKYSKATIDYFLAHEVFPKEMKEFPYKLSASGWDIGQERTHPTTGFSGTNDSHHVLPLSVEQLHLPDQKHTNTLVLKHLLQPENSVEIVLGTEDGDKVSTFADLLLNKVVVAMPPVRVILDVGAQIIELDNFGVAKKWLSMLPEEQANQNVEAAVFFDHHDNLCVVDRKGRVELLSVSTYATQLDVCLVFLDDAHTRGTDLKLPKDYRAAVTLGANLVKDRLVQACMRMRQLGQGQSVVFFVPEEIKRKTERLQSAGDLNREIDVSDVLHWAMNETWRDASRSIPIWATQGRTHHAQSTYWSEAGLGHAHGLSMSQQGAQKFQQEEAQTIEQRYRPQSSCAKTARSCRLDKTGHVEAAIAERCRKFGVLQTFSAALLEEQEREMSPEVEEERQIQRPEPAEPLPHHLHPDVKAFVETGVISLDSNAFLPAFQSLSNSSAKKHIGALSSPVAGPWVTKDFSQTVKYQHPSYVSDSYSRPVQWILTSPRTARAPDAAIKYMAIISPYEAQELLPTIRKSLHTSLHTYAPLANTTNRCLDTLNLYTAPHPIKLSLPRPMIMRLNLFAGQMYSKTLSDANELKEFMAIGCGLLSMNQGSSKKQSDDRLVCVLKAIMMRIRRNCESIDKTHIGHILDGRDLAPYQFRQSRAEE